MATVYRARDRQTEAFVAVKIMRRELNADRRYLQRFEREARITQSLQSPSIVRTLDFGQNGSDFFLVMEWVDGTDLKSLIREHGALSPQEAKRIAHSVVEALSEAHDKGVIHRDIKPQNILIG